MVAIGPENTAAEEREQTRKRRRLTWDVAPLSPENQAAEAEEKDKKIQKVEPPSRLRYLSPPHRDDDRDGHYVFSLGENLTPRYKILSKMGEGTFGRVLECWDRQTREYVAIKVVRSIKKYREAAMIEVNVLQRLSENDTGNSHCVQMRSWFDYRNHICIVFEKLGPSLYDLLKRNKYCPFPLDLVREFGRQLLESVTYMHGLRLIHTDLKPENILLVSSESIRLPSYKRSSVDMNRCLPKSSAIKLIDFGSTVFDDKLHSSIVCTRHYRAPEIILGLGWTYPCDLWSVGCILVELYSVSSAFYFATISYFGFDIFVIHVLGISEREREKRESQRAINHIFSDKYCSRVKLLFQTHENLEHLAMMERVLGPLPQHMIQKANRGADKYFKRSRLNWPGGAVSRESIRAVNKLDRLKDLVSRHVEFSRSPLTDLLQGLLKYDPSERLTAEEALNHPFFSNAA